MFFSFSCDILNGLIPDCTVIPFLEDSSFGGSSLEAETWIITGMVYGHAAAGGHGVSCRHSGRPWARPSYRGVAQTSVHAQLWIIDPSWSPILMPHMESYGILPAS